MYSICLTLVEEVKLADSLLHELGSPKVSSEKLLQLFKCQFGILLVLLTIVRLLWSTHQSTPPPPLPWCWAGTPALPAGTLPPSQTVAPPLCIQQPVHGTYSGMSCHLTHSTAAPELWGRMWGKIVGAHTSPHAADLSQHLSDRSLPAVCTHCHSPGCLSHTQGCTHGDTAGDTLGLGRTPPFSK